MTVHQPSVKGGFATWLFYNEPAGIFAEGHIFTVAPDIPSDLPNHRIGYWHCDIADGDRLTWSDKVYELFGLPNGARIDRAWAVARYSERSRGALEKVRSYALRRKFGFILDAEICPEEGDGRLMRLLAVPIMKRDRVVGLHGLKRSL